MISDYYGLATDTEDLANKLPNAIKVAHSTNLLIGFRLSSEDSAIIACSAWFCKCNASQLWHC